MVEKIQPSTSLFANLPKGTSKSGYEKNDPFRGLNLDKLGLSEDAKNKVMWARSQFEVNYQAFNSMNSANGEQTFQESFSFKASYEFLQMASGREPIAAPASTDETATQDPEQDALTSLQEYFSPENTAQRILDMATSFFSYSKVGQEQGNTEASRKTFADFIGGAINTGFQQARDILGELPEDILTGISKTHSLVFSGLEDFIKNGIDPEKAQAGGIYDKIAAYRKSRVSVASTSKSSSTVSYDAKGDTKNTPVDSPKLSTKG